MNEKMKGNRNRLIRYDETSKQGTLRMIATQKMPMKQISEDLSVDSLRHWLKKSGLKIQALESELKSLIDKFGNTLLSEKKS